MTGQIFGAEVSRTVIPVSILLPIRNGARFVGAAIDSILAQSFADFELIVVDDASADGTTEILRKCRDPRLVSQRNESHAGLAHSLNLALDTARGRFVARMDADDIAMPDRLERQVAFLEAHPDIGILGTACQLIDENGVALRVVPMPASELAIRWRVLTGNPFLHPSVMLRRSVLDLSGLRYDESLATAQDYDLWVRLLRRTRGANLEEPLLSIRVHADSVSATMAADQSDTHVRIALREIAELWPEHSFDFDSFALLRWLLTEMRPLSGAADRERYRLVTAYAELLERFGKRHRAHVDWPGLRRSETVAATFLTLLPPWHRGVRAVTRRLAGIEPNLFSAFLAWVFNTAARRLGKSWLTRARRRAA